MSLASAASAISTKAQADFGKHKASANNADLLSEITDSFHADHNVQRAAVETRYAGGSALNGQLLREGEALPDSPRPNESQEEFEERRTGMNRAAPPVLNQKFTDAAADLYKKHGTLRTTGVVETKGGNKDLLSDINDEFMKEHMLQRAEVDSQTPAEDAAVNGPPALVKVSASAGAKAGAAAPAGPPRINRTSVGAAPNKELTNAAAGFAAKHEAMRQNLANPTKVTTSNHDLLSEVTDQFHQAHAFQRSSMDPQNMMSAASAPAYNPTMTPSAAASALRRASMGAVPNANTLDTVPERKVKDSVWKKLGRMFTGESSPKSQPKLAQRSMHAVSDISTKSRGIHRSSMNAVTAASSGASSPSGVKRGSSGAEMLGTLCDEWHERNAALPAQQISVAAYNPARRSSVEHAQLEY